MALPDLVRRAGRRRKPDPPVEVTVVLASGEEHRVPADSPLARSMSEVAHLLAHW